MLRCFYYVPVRQSETGAMTEMLSLGTETQDSGLTQLTHIQTWQGNLLQIPAECLIVKKAIGRMNVRRFLKLADVLSWGFSTQPNKHIFTLGSSRTKTDNLNLIQQTILIYSECKKILSFLCSDMLHMVSATQHGLVVLDFGPVNQLY